MALRAYFLFVVLILLSKTFAEENADVDFSAAIQDSNPVDDVQPDADDKDRNERSIFFKTKQPVENSQYNYGPPHNHGGFGFGGYGGGGGGGGASFGGGYGVKTSRTGFMTNALSMLGFKKPTSAESTQNFLFKESLQLRAQGSCPAYILPNNVQHNCHDGNCEVSCPGRFTFPDGSKVLKLSCIGGIWIIRDSNFEKIPPCQTTCVPPCQNNGICIDNGICVCPEQFSGPLCQYKKSVCAMKPPIPKNSKLSCRNNICNAECMRGFQFPDGSTITNIECQNSQWIHTKTGYTKPPDCMPTCTPSCLNGGRCISFNVCQCSKLHRGNHCQFSISACNVTNSGFNGNFKCTYDNDEAKCKFSCPAVPNLKVQGDLDIEYKCSYGLGKFMPQPLPKCIFPPGVTITRKKTTVHESMTNKTISRGGGGMSFEQESMTEREKIMFIIAKYRDYEHKTEYWSSEESASLELNSYGLYTSSDLDVVIDTTPKYALCTTWGGNNMKTFDGLVFKAPLSCSHTLITDKLDATFDVILKACPFGSGYGCAHALKIYWQSILYTFENLNGTIRLSTPTKNLPLPVQVMGMKVMPVAQHVQIELESVGLKIDWDRHQYVAVQAGPALWKKVGGLCGALDGDLKNDLMSKHGKVLATVKTFVDSWRVEDKSDLCIMQNSAELEFGYDKCEPGKHKKAVEICERLLANDKLHDCIKEFNFEALLRTCISDYCNCPNRDRPETCNCDAAAMLAKECTFKGIKLEHGWRNLEICPISCNFGRVYRACGPDVEPTCESDFTPTKDKCNEGCFCPEGTVQYKDACITKELCPCTLRGREFKPEAKIRKKCNSCTCKNGQWKCTDEECGARCGAIGDPHYQTFDGKRYDFMGKCSYYLLKTPTISVEAENVACSGAISEALNLAPVSDDPSCTKSVTLRFNLKNGAAIKIKLAQGLATFVNDKQVMKFPRVLGAGEVLLRQASSTFVTVEFPNGIRVWWDGVSRAYIDVPPNFRDKTAGLCGTFNSNTQDDFLTPEGDVETAVEPFADKWRTKDTCDFLVQNDSGPHPCTANPEMRSIAEKHCAWITDDIFQDCHWTVETEQYYEDCLYDVCACKDDPSKCFCPILAAYGMECMRQGVKTGWRLAVKDCALKCPLGQVYDECGDTCALTCEDLPRKKTCQRECIEGCRCPHGEYLNDQNECVPQSKCHCTYNGISFKPGYKEVRPGERALDLCTCVNGLWECEDAGPDDEQKYPPAVELRAKCAKTPFAEFTECAPNEPKTCKNMHEYVPVTEECVPNCVCMDGYVYDTSRKTCVLPESCSCHHAGKSFDDGANRKEDCGTCICMSGKWNCTSQSCESTCSVWGDSHFSTYDGLDFDFQGACDYVLSKGVFDNGDGYSITIQNVLCGTMGVTCSKSLQISLTGSVKETVQLAADGAYTDDPNKTAIKKLRDAVNAQGSGAFHIYKTGTFIVVEVIPLKLQVKWDEGTRVYVKLGSEWRNKVSGLCGNYNGNSMDDMQTPSQGLETSPLIFGHSWKVQPFCAPPTQLIDSCKEHPERETWAQLKCGVLKSELFESCHGEVQVEKYLKRCIFDTCACDQGGDCECLCTAVAAYAHACAQKGINIRWRTPHFCPMQCDPHCSDYKACTPACAVETCDNFLDQGIAERMCNKENCIEGCLIKPCEEGMIYSNDTYKECVPKAQCKPVCMVKDEKTYYEGDITYMDECATCRCSKKKEVCSGVKCQPITERPIKGPEGTTEKPSGTQDQPKCVRGWTRWFDKDEDGSGKLIRLNDEEKLPRYDSMENIYGTCLKKYMKKIECRVVDSHESSDYMDENVFCNLQDGLACVGQCHDYEIRVFCQCEEEPEVVQKTTEKPQIGRACDSAVAEFKEFPGDCHKFLQCQPKSVQGGYIYVEQTCGEYMMFNPTMNICDHISTVQEIKPICGKPAKEIEKHTCPEGQIMSDCANQCEHTCHHYGTILQKRGLCKPNEHCKSGCVDKYRPDCPKMGKYWRDENTCVLSDECPCMDKSEKYVQPHEPVIGEFEVCQCIDNAYTCVPNKIIEKTTIPPPIYVTKPPLYEVFPSTVTPPVECLTDRLVPIIEGYEPLPDSVFNASSQLGYDYAPQQARLLKDTQQKSGGWSPSINDQMQYLEVNFAHPEPLFGVLMAGHTNFDNYVTLFKILHSHDGVAYHYLVDETEKPQLFNGPLDSRTAVRTLFKIPIEAKSVRIYPLKWHGSIAMRVELLGCGPTLLSTPPSFDIVTAPTKPSQNLEMELECVEKMGVENGLLHESQVKSSSIWSLPRPAKKPKLIDLLKLSSNVGWRSLANTPREYVEFDFLEPRNISGFITKGGPDGYVTGYNVLFSKNRLIWNKILAPTGQPRVFDGNRDADTEQTNYFTKPILTQYLKLVPTKWEHNINMRIEPIGCFKPYPEIKIGIEEVEKTKPTPKCNVCDGIILLASEDCKCTDGLYWDGKKCLQQNLCPCVENYVTYPIGSKFENKECQDCVCVLGGHKNCKPKKCPPCENKELRPVVTSGCFCKCEPCPKYQKLCPSSGDCIPELLWCNGIQDCADDEDASCMRTFTDRPDSTTVKNETEITTCPTPECPPQTKMKLTEKKIRKMSQMFSSSFNKQVSIVDDGYKVTKTKVISSKEEFLATPSGEYDYLQDEACSEFTCVPIPTKVSNISEIKTCGEPKCPDNYDIEVDLSSAKAGDCTKYTCTLRPRKDNVCELSGKTFTTFDGTEFKYDTCSHILARDLVNSSWIVSVHLQCNDDTRKVCRKIVTIKDLSSDNTLNILPNQKVNFNGFDFTVQQLINSPICKASFIVSQPGNTVLVVSSKHGYWVQYDDIGIIKVGVSSKYMKTVDGLCGYYNGIPGDDKRTPDGTIMPNTVKFGDSWFDKKVPLEECYPQVCPIDMQRKALAICNTIKHPTFLRCNKAINYKQFVTKCIETTCDCLNANNGDASVCKCNILQDFVKKCLTVNPNVQLTTWRAVHQCEIACPAPLVHSDCYKRRCEPSCDTLHSEDCPVIPDACFPGCYCPDGTVRKGKACVPIAECKDCVCESFGASKYVTYDRKSFTFNGNCTYLLSRDIVLPGVHTFQVYVTMDECQKLGQPAAAAHESCAKSLHVLNGDHVIHIQRVPGKPKVLQVFVDGFDVKKLPYKDTWISLREVVGKELVLSLPDTHVDLIAGFNNLVFTLGVPSVKYGSKMEGLCGDCNGDAKNDLQENPAKKKGRKPSKELGDVIKSWQADEPKLGLEANECLSEDVPKDECLPPPPEKDPCLQVFNKELFDKCPLIVDPAAYISACQQDMCKPGNNQKGVCDSLGAYAKQCNKNGICVNWRRPNLCPYDCPADMLYEPCGCAKTCDTVKDMSIFEAINVRTSAVVKTINSDELCSNTERYEGCFCPPGTVLDNGKCIKEAECNKCDDSIHLPGETWQLDKCTECKCDDKGKTSCVEKKCVIEENICAENYMPKVVSEDECCPRYRCVPKPQKQQCLAPLMPICGPGQIKTMKIAPDGCQEYICECKPKEDCESLAPPRELQPGEKLVKIEEGCCPTQKIVCDKSNCPAKPQSCVEDFYEVSKKQGPDDCCPTYKCVPPKDVCIVKYEFDEFPFTKKIGEKWLHTKDVCKEQLCAYGPNESTQIITTTATCIKVCEPGFTYVNKDPSKCCGECVQTACVLDGKLYEPEEQWNSIDNCTLYTCIKKGDMLIISSSKETCPDVSNCPAHLQYEEDCCKRCKPEPGKPQDKSQCLPVSLAENETKEIIKYEKDYHGICTNAEPIKGFTECVGACNSGSKYNKYSDNHDKYCHCCTIQKYQKLSIRLVCEDGFEFVKEHNVPESCGCSPCSDSEDFNSSMLAV